MAAAGVQLTLCTWMVIVAAALTPLTWAGTPKVRPHCARTHARPGLLRIFKLSSELRPEIFSDAVISRIEVFFFIRSCVITFKSGLVELGVFPQA